MRLLERLLRPLGMLWGLALLACPEAGLASELSGRNEQVLAGYRSTELEPVSYGPVSVVLRGRFLSEGSSIRLGDVAALSGSAETLKVLQDLIVMDAPGVGQERKLTVEQIQSSIQRVLPGVPASFSGATSVAVAVSGVVFDADKIVEIASQSVKEYFADRDDLDVSIEVTSRPGPLTVPPGHLEFRVDNVWNGMPIGIRRFRVLVLKDGKQIRDAIVGLNVRIFQDSLVAAGTIETGAVVGPRDFKVQREEVKGRGLYPNISMNRIVGLQAKHQIPEGRRIEPRYFESLPVIRRGDRVIVEIARGGLTIKAVAQARNDATLGETVRLRLVDGDQEILARASGPGTASL